ncbi:MAG: conjugal transfer protein TraG, partial [Caulobacter sp. 32-67-35]
HLICQSFNDVFSKYGDKTPIFDNMHITATFATSEPTSIDKVIRRAGKALEMRESYSDPRSIFGSSHRSTSQSEHERYILTEDRVRELDDNQQFLFVNNTKPIRAEKIRYYDEPFFKARTGDYFHGVPAKYEQRPGAADLPGPAQIDWLGVRAAEPAPDGLKGVVPPSAPAAADEGPQSAGDGGHGLHAPVSSLRWTGDDDDDGSLG